MNSPMSSNLQYTIDHFRQIARWNRFPENATIEHDRERCLICHPERADRDPFLIYLEVVVQSVLVRRPRIDEELVAAINSDLELAGHPDHDRVSLESLINEDPAALDRLRDWIRSAIDTGLELLSIHCDSALEFSLEEMEEAGYGAVIAAAVEEVLRCQLQSG